MQDDGSEFKNKFFIVGLFCIFPGAIIGAIIYLKTKVSEAPNFLVIINAFICFIMAVVWIQFTSNVIMDLL